MTGEIEVDFDALQLAIDGLVSELAELNLALDTFNTESAYVLLQWQGEAADAFQTSQQSWAQDGVVRRDELERMIAALREALESYSSTEQRLRALCGVA